MRILIVDDDPSTETALAGPLSEVGVKIDTARDSMIAMEMLSHRQYAAIVITPLIRNRLNGFAVLSYIEQERPEMLSTVFILTVLPKETIKRMAPGVSRCFRKCELASLAATLAQFCGRTNMHEPGASVLLAEDDAETASIECEILHELGYSCRWVSRGSDVLDAVRCMKFDALLLDVIMPDIDALEMLEALRTTAPDLLRRVVVVTGLPPQYLEEIRGYPVCGILPKPVDAGKLRTLLARCAAGS